MNGIECNRRVEASVRTTRPINLRSFSDFEAQFGHGRVFYKVPTKVPTYLE